MGFKQIGVTLRWLLLVAAVVVTPVDYGRIGLTEADDVDIKKWIIRFPFWYAPLALIIPRWGLILEVLRRPPISWLLAWCGLGAASVLWAVSPDQAMLIGLAMTTLALLAVWQVFDRGWHSFATAMVTGLTIVIVLGILLDLRDGLLFAGRPAGLTSNATSLSRLGLLNVLLAAGLIWSKRAHPVIWVAPVVGMIVLLLSETRTALIALVVGLAYGGLRRFSPQVRWMLAAGTVVGGGALLVLIGSLTAVGELGERGDPTSLTGRTSIWPAVVNRILRRPILGHGVGSEEAVLRQVARDGDLDFLAGTTHSMYLSPWLSGGLIGFLLLATALVSTMRRRRNVDPWIVAPIIAILITGLTEAIVHLPTVSFLVMSGCLAAIAASEGNFVHSSPGARRGGFRRRKLASVRPSG